MLFSISSFVLSFSFMPVTGIYSTILVTLDYKYFFVYLFSFKMHVSITIIHIAQYIYTQGNTRIIVMLGKVYVQA